MKLVIGSINWAQGNRIMSSFYHFETSARTGHRLSSFADGSDCPTIGPDGECCRCIVQALIGADTFCPPSRGISLCQRRQSGLKTGGVGPKSSTDEGTSQFLCIIGHNNISWISHDPSTPRSGGGSPQRIRLITAITKPRSSNHNKKTAMHKIAM